MGFGTPPGVTKHTELTDKEVVGVIDHADLSVTDAKLASGVGLSDGQICKLPVAVADKVLKRGATAWEAGDVPAGLTPWEDYFYWLFLIDSLDGIYQITTGSASITYGTTGDLLLMNTGTTKNSVAKLEKWQTYLGDILLRWDKKRKIRTVMSLDSVADVTVFLCSGYDIITTPTREHVGFKIINDSLYGTVADGTTEATLLPQTIDTSVYTLECVFSPSIPECRFFVDGVDKGAITTNLPTTAWTGEYVPMHVAIENTVAADKRLNFPIWEFWQDR